MKQYAHSITAKANINRKNSFFASIYCISNGKFSELDEMQVEWFVFLFVRFVKFI